MRIVTSIACCLLFVLAIKIAAAQARQYIWSDIDCRQSRIAAWPGLKCRATNVVTSEGNIGVFRQWAAFEQAGTAITPTCSCGRPRTVSPFFRRRNDGRLRERDI
jgi:hypothetical protein